MRKSKELKFRSKPALAIVVDGDTEIWYFEMLKRNERNLRVTIKPEIPNKKSIEEQVNLVKKLAKSEYTKVFWIVDLDTVIKESKENKAGTESPMQAFVKYRTFLKKEYENVITIVNNPCLEFWFLLHFEKTSKLFENCLTAEKQLKKYLKDYEKTQKYFTKQGGDIYLKLRPNLNMALENAGSPEFFNNEEPMKTISEMQFFYLSAELREHFQ